MSRPAPEPPPGYACLARLGLLAAAAALAGCPPQTVQGPPVELKGHAEPEFVGVEHRIRPGETLWRISQAYGVPVDEISLTNGITDPTVLEVGRILFIAGAKRPARVEPAQSADPRPERPKPALEPGKAPLRWPLIGVLYAKFGRRGESYHEGIDLAAPEGSVIGAAADGMVLFSGQQRGYGHIVILEHAGGLLTLYAHNQQNLVKEGARVRAGDPIARVGPGTRTSGPHLHFEVREGRKPKDPLEYLSEPR